MSPPDASFGTRRLRVDRHHVGTDDTGVGITYNDAQAPLEALLQSIDRPGDYCMQGRVFVPMPRVEVARAGVLSFPVTPPQAQALIAVAESAPYGRGEQTLVDSSVRACWQIDAEQITVTGGVWRDTLTDISARAATGLGCPPEHTEAHLYKLLVYEPGGFFAAHRDTEKVDGMIATMVLSLPVAGAGGELVIRHKERETVVDMRTAEPSELAFAAFYADCIHETLPVSAGHRIAMVYHLVLRKGAASGALQTAPDFSAQEERIAAQLRTWETSATAGNKLVWLLEHDYSEAGLSFDVLKNADAAVGGALARAAQRAGQSLHAAILHIEEHGIAVEPADYFDRDPGSSWEMEEVYDTEIWLDGWVDPNGTKRDYGRVPLLPGELLPAGALEDAEPDDEQINVTGNEGVELSHTYRRAAVVLWPERHTVRTLAHGGIGGALAYVADELARIDATGNARALVAQIIDAWPAPLRSHPYRRYETADAAGSCTDALRLLRGLGDEVTTGRFLHEVLTAHYSGEENSELLETAATLSPVTLHGWLPEFTAKALPRRPEAVLDLLRRLCEHEMSRPEQGGPWRAALRDAARSACRVLPEIVRAGAGSDPEADFLEDGDRFGSTIRRDRSGSLSAQAIRSLFALIWYGELAEEAEEAAVLLTRHPAAATPDRAVPQALAELAAHQSAHGAVAAGFGMLWRHAAHCLLARSDEPPEQPRDWVTEAAISCSCPSCRRLRAFCADPVETTLRLPLRKELRRHVHGIIECHRLDMLHETERVGRPYTLVCTKTRGAYEQRCAQYALDISHMRLLATAARGEPDAAYRGELSRLRAAIERSAAGREWRSSADGSFLVQAESRTAANDDRGVRERRNASHGRHRMPRSRTRRPRYSRIDVASG